MTIAENLADLTTRLEDALTRHHGQFMKFARTRRVFTMRSHQIRPADTPCLSYGEEAGLPFLGLGHRGEPTPIDKTTYI